MTRRPYAASTAVPVSRTRGEIEDLLERRGADQFAYATTETNAQVLFRLDWRYYRITLPLPLRTEKRFTHTPDRGWERGPEAARQAWEQECRRLWRSLLAYLKARFIAVDDGIASMEQAFLPETLTPDGATLAEVALPAIAAAYQTGQMPALLPEPVPAKGSLGLWDWQPPEGLVLPELRRA